MKKVIFQFFVLACLFGGTYFLLNQVDWMGVLRIKEAKKTTEEKLGDLLWGFFSKSDTEIHSKIVTHAIDTLVSHLCEANSINKSKIKIHILQNEQVNAFTLPNNYLVVYSGLITDSENEAELVGVLGHELAHIEKNHVMKKLIKEIGLSVLISITTGSGGETIKQAAKLLSSTAYDRDLEREADLTSVDFMIKANIDPEPFANFLYRMADRERNLPSEAFWISTHPDSKERSENIIAYFREKKINKTSVLTKDEWSKLKAQLEEK